GAGLFDGVKPIEVHIGAVHQIERSGFIEQLVQPFDFLIIGQTDQHLRGQMRVQFQLSMDLQSRPQGVEACPGINRQTEIDDAGVQCINGLVQIQNQRLVGVELSCLPNQPLGQICKDAPVANRQGIGERAAADRAAQPQMIELIGACVQTRFDVAQTFPPGQLGKNQADELLPAGEMFDLVGAAIALNAAMKLFAMDQAQELGQDVLTGVHASRIAAQPSFLTPPSSNASHSLNYSFAA